MIDWGYKAQRLAHRALKTFAKAQTRRPPATTGKAADPGAGHPLRQQADAGRPAEDARRARCSTSRTAITCPSSAILPRPAANPKRCFISRAAAPSACSRRWVSPPRPCSGTSACRPCCRPGYLCCGYPQRGAGEFDKAEKIITDNRVLFHRVANTLNYLDIKTVVVSLRHLLRPACRATNSSRYFPAAEDHRHP